MTWAARAQGTGAIVVKVRDRDDGRADERTRWCAVHLPALGVRGYPVPAIVWHGISAQWHVTVQNRLPGRPLTALDGPMVEAALRPLELQADVGIPAGRRVFTGYVANVLPDLPGLGKRPGVHRSGSQRVRAIPQHGKGRQ